jgi:transglutaminase-like putative cysteine protease
VTDIRQFRPAVYALVLLGCTGFSFATGRWGLWLVIVTAILANWWLWGRGGRGRPIPRLVANAITIAAGVWAVRQVVRGDLPVEPIGVFLVILQAVKLYEQRGNRDYGQLIVLSLLTMVAAAMTSGGVSLIFGGTFVVWIFLSLYTCLLFHLKVEADAASRAMGLTVAPIESPRLRQDRRRLGSSMRRLTGAVAAGAVLFGTTVFILFPRGQGSGFLVAPQGTGGSRTGFSDTVDFQNIARIQQDDAVQGYVTIERAGQPVRTGPIYLRGGVLDLYDGNPDSPGRWQWRVSDALAVTRTPLPAGRSRPMSLSSGGPPNRSLLVQRYEMLPTGSSSVIALAGQTGVVFHDELPTTANLAWSPIEGVLRFARGITPGRIDYTVWSTGRPPTPAVLPVEAIDPDPARRMLRGVDWPAHHLSPIRDRLEGIRLLTRHYVETGVRLDDSQAVGFLRARLGRQVTVPQMARPDLTPARSSVDGLAQARMPSEQIVAFALDPAVTGTDARGRSLARLRLERAGTTPLDAIIADNLEAHLRTQFVYSLDVSAEASRLPTTADPLGWFVSEQGRAGHCEFFAGAMAQACQALGIPARVVVGFRTIEFNPQINKFTIRRSDAHAWVEVLTQQGWQRYDPTSDTPADLERRDPGGWVELGRRFRQMGDFVQYVWANHVIGYDRNRQADVGEAGRTLMSDLNRQMGQAMAGADESVEDGWLRRLLLNPLGDLRAWLERQNLYVFSATLMTALLVTLPIAALGLVILFFALKWRLTRRARRIGLDDLPPSIARRLARRLAFYDELVRTLHRGGLHRPGHHTPREFARSLAFLPPEAFDAVARMTEDFYRVRYGYVTDGRIDHRRDVEVVARALRNAPRT